MTRSDCFLPVVNTHNTAGIVPQQSSGASSRREARRNPPTRRGTGHGLSISLVLPVVLLFSTAHAGGLDDYEPAPDPCPPGVVTGVTGEMLAGFMAIREMSCGERPVRAFFDRATGEQLTDDEILRRIFATPVPLPAGGWLLLGALALLFFSGRPVEQDGGPREPQQRRGGFVP